MTETSYSSNSVASCPHCFRILIASASVLPWRRIPSMLNNRSPGLIVPSLKGWGEVGRERVTKALEGQKASGNAGVRGRSPVSWTARPNVCNDNGTRLVPVFMSAACVHTHARHEHNHPRLTHIQTNPSPLMTKPKLFPSLCRVTSTFLNMTPDPCTAATGHDTSTIYRSQTRGAADGTPAAVLTHRWQLVLHLQDHSFSHVLQQADDLVVPELGQVDSVHRADVVAHVQLVAPVEPVHFHQLA